MNLQTATNPSFRCDYQSLLEIQKECVERMLASPEQAEDWRRVWIAAEMALIATSEALIY